MGDVWSERYLVYIWFLQCLIETVGCSGIKIPGLVPADPYLSIDHN